MRDLLVLLCVHVVIKTVDMKNFHVVIWQTTSENCTKERAPRAARLSFLIQPIKSLVCGVDIAVLVVISFKLPISALKCRFTLIRLIFWREIRLIFCPDQMREIRCSLKFDINFTKCPGKSKNKPSFLLTLLRVSVSASFF